MSLLPPRSTRTATLFPDTTLFRSIDVFRTHHRRGHQNVAFVLAVLVIHEDDHLAGLEVSEDILGRIELARPCVVDIRNFVHVHSSCASCTGRRFPWRRLSKQADRLSNSIISTLKQSFEIAGNQIVFEIDRLPWPQRS